MVAMAKTGETDISPEEEQKEMPVVKKDIKVGVI